MADDRLAHQVGLIGAGPDRPTDVISKPALALFKNERIDPPSRVYLTRNDRLFFAASANASSNPVTLRGRRLDVPTGQVLPFEIVLTPTGGRVFSTTTVELAEGWLLSLAVQGTNGFAQSGAGYCVVAIVRPNSSGAQSYETLLMGYWNNSTPISWPEFPLRYSTDGPPALVTVVGTTPAAGAEIAETVPTGARWKLRALQVTFTTSAAVANRNPVFIFDDGVNVFCRTGTDVLITASQGRFLQLFHATNRSTAATVTDLYIPIPAELSLANGYRIRTVTANIQAADQYSALVYNVEELLYNG